MADNAFNQQRPLGPLTAVSSPFRPPALSAPPPTVQVVSVAHFNAMLINLGVGLMVPPSGRPHSGPNASSLNHQC